MVNWLVHFNFHASQGGSAAHDRELKALAVSRRKSEALKGAFPTFNVSARLEHVLFKSVVELFRLSTWREENKESAFSSPSSPPRRQTKRRTHQQQVSTILNIAPGHPGACHFPIDSNWIGKGCDGCLSPHFSTHSRNRIAHFKTKFRCLSIAGMVRTAELELRRYSAAQLVDTRRRCFDNPIGIGNRNLSAVCVDNEASRQLSKGFTQKTVN